MGQLIYVLAKPTIPKQCLLPTGTDVPRYLPKMTKDAIPAWLVTLDTFFSQIVSSNVKIFSPPIPTYIISYCIDFQELHSVYSIAFVSTFALPGTRPVKMTVRFQYVQIL